jgi:integrase
VRGALLTGSRYGELTAVRTAEVTLEDDTGRVFIRESKSGKPRHVPLSAEGRAFFAEQTAGKPGSDFVFLKKDGTRWARNHAVRPLMLACGLAKIERRFFTT